MRNSDRKAAFWFAVLTVGLGLIAYGYPRLEAYAPSPPAAVIATLGGFLLAVAGGTLFLFAFLFARGQANLLAARDAGTLVARWPVDAADWERFRAIDRARAAEHRELINHFRLGREPPRPGSEILVGDSGLLVDGVYHALLGFGAPALTAVGWLGPPADPECLEFRLLTVTRFGSYRGALRLPVPAAARAQGVRAYEHFCGARAEAPQAAQPARRRNHRRHLRHRRVRRLRGRPRDAAGRRPERDAGDPARVGDDRPFPRRLPGAHRAAGQPPAAPLGTGMRNPARTAIIWFCVLAAGLALMAYGWRLDGPDSAKAMIWGFGFPLTVIGALSSLSYGRHARDRARLLRARHAGSLVARWHVGAAELERFRAIDRDRAAQHRQLGNHFVPLPRTPPLGLDILVGGSAILVGDRYYYLGRWDIYALEHVGWLGPPADPECIEFNPVKRSGWIFSRSTLRLPVPAAARAQGMRAYDHFAPRVVNLTIAPRPRAELIATGVVAFVGLVTLAAGWRTWRGGTAETALMLIVSGICLVVIALPFALRALLSMRAGNR